MLASSAKGALPTADLYVDSPHPQHSRFAPVTSILSSLIRLLTKSPLVRPRLDQYLMRGAMIVVFVFFGYQKWFAYEAQALIPYISHGPFSFWLYPTFGIRGGSSFLGVIEWLIAVLLIVGF